MLWLYVCVCVYVRVCVCERERGCLCAVHLSDSKCVFCDPVMTFPQMKYGLRKSSCGRFVPFSLNFPHLKD